MRTIQEIKNDFISLAAELAEQTDSDVEVSVYAVSEMKAYARFEKVYRCEIKIY